MWVTLTRDWVLGVSNPSTAIWCEGSGYETRRQRFGVPVVIKMDDNASSLESCIFCQIAGKKRESKVVYEDEEFVAFPDIHPAAEHHYLVIPKSHFGNPKTLDGRHHNLVQRMNHVAQKLLQENNGDLEDVKIGFHWPPFNSVQHLHLHVIFPASKLNVKGRLVYRENSWWFASIQWTLDHLAKKFTKDGKLAAKSNDLNDSTPTPNL